MTSESAVSPADPILHVTPDLTPQPHPQLQVYLDASGNPFASAASGIAELRRTHHHNCLTFGGAPEIVASVEEIMIGDVAARRLATLEEPMGPIKPYRSSAFNRPHDAPELKSPQVV